MEKGELEAVNTDMRLLQTTIGESRDLQLLLSSPIIKSDKKKEILFSVFQNKIGNLTFSFLNLLTTKGRENELPSTAISFLDQFNVYKGIKIVKVTSAVVLDDTLKEGLRNKLSSLFKDAKIELKTEVDPSIIGGFALDFDNLRVDATLKKRLQQIKQQFTGNTYVPLM